MVGVGALASQNSYVQDRTWTPLPPIFVISEMTPSHSGKSLGVILDSSFSSLNVKSKSISKSVKFTSKINPKSDHFSPPILPQPKSRSPSHSPVLLARPVKGVPTFAPRSPPRGQSPYGRRVIFPTSIYLIITFPCLMPSNNFSLQLEQNHSL